MVKLRKTSARDQGYAGPAERHMANRRAAHQREAETERVRQERLDKEREQRLIQKQLEDIEISR